MAAECSKIMNLLVSVLFSVCMTGFSTLDDDSLLKNDKFSCDSVLRPYVFLSGITSDALGCIVCDYKGDRILRITDRGEVETVVENIDAPVDVEYVGDSLWILLNSPQKALLSWNPITGEWAILFNQFDLDSNLTAFAALSQDIVYVVDFTGVVYRIDLLKQTKTIAIDGLDNPADIALLPEGGFAVTEQIGGDTRDGCVHFFLPNGQERRVNLIDPTGLAMGPDGRIYVSVFGIEQTPSSNRPDDPANEYPSRTLGGGIYRFDTAISEPVLVSRGLIGPTSLVVLSNNDLLAIDETQNAIFKISPRRGLETIFQGTISPLAVRTFSDRTAVYLINRQQRYEVMFARVENANAESSNIIISSGVIWSTSDLNRSVPLIEIGGDTLLYIYDPYFQEILIYDSTGTFVNSFLVFAQQGRLTQLLADPTGGVAIAVWDRESVSIRKVDRERVGDSILYSGYYSGSIYLDSNGNVRDIGKENALPPETVSGGQVASNTNGDLWFADPEKGNIYIVRNNQLELVVGGLGAIKDLSSDGGNGVNVTTQDGRVYHLTPRTPVLQWTLY